MFKDLNEFIAALDKERELARIAEPVSPDLEICAVTDRVSKSPGGGPGLLFEQPTGFDMPVAINLFGSMKRMCMALGVRTLDDLAHEIEELTTPKMPAGMLDALKMLPMVNRLRDLMPKTVSDAPCQEVVEEGRHARRDSDPQVLARRRRPLHHAADGVHARIPKPACATSAPIACRCSTAGPPACTGSGTRAARSTTASPSGWGSGCRSPWRSAPIPRCVLPRPRRCPKGSTS